MKTGYTLDQAMREAQRCLLCHDAPCSAGCPAGTDPAAFIRKLRLKNLKGAIRTIKKNNVFGGVCGFLCPTGRLCEERCAATGIDVTISIGKIQRTLVEIGWSIGLSPRGRALQRKGKIAIVGSGPSGLACAAEISREGFEPVVLERKGKAGGVLSHLLPSQRLPGGFLEREIEEIRGLGVEIRCGSQLEGREAIARLLESGYRAVYLATGTWRPVRLDIPGRDLEGVRSSLEFLEKTRAFGETIRGRNVLVVGGGEVALDVAETAKSLGGQEVYLLYRRSFLEMPADLKRRESAFSSGVHLLFLTQPVKYLGEVGRVKGAVVVRNRPGEKDETGRARPVEVPGSQHTIPADAVIEALGWGPLDGCRELFSGLRLSKDDLVVVDEKSGQTTMKNVFAGGDAVRGPSLVVNAVADGKRAARAIVEALS